MKYGLFLFLLLTITRASATNYYFSSALGEDNRSPMQAKNPATPWKTLDKLNSFFSNLKPGDSVLLKRGDTFFGSIIVTRSGTSTAPIVIGAYGSRNKPVVTGFTALTFSPLGNNIYESQVLAPANVNVLTVDGSLEAMGRYPNSGYLSFESHSGTSSITDNDLTASPNWTGAELVLRSRRWILDRDLITNHSGNTISYTAASKYEPRDKSGYFIQNSPLTLDKDGEWYYNPSTKKISLFSSSAPKNVNVAVLDNLITSSGNSNVSFDNITIQGASKNDVLLRSGSNIKFTSCDILFSGEYGVSVNNHANFSMENCTVANSLTNGIFLNTGSGAAVLRNNLIQNTSVLQGMGANGEGKGIAIYTKSKNSLIEYNKIINTGFIGIHFSSDYAIIKNNYIDSFCYVKDDGGGIYSYTGSGIPGVGRKIIGNIITHGLGAPEGTDNVRQFAAAGIYLDDNTSDVEIRDNTVANCNNQGIFLQNASSIIVTNNTFFDNSLQLSMIQRPNKLVRNNIITQNIFFSKLPVQTGSFFLSAAKTDVDLFGKFDSNYYAKPLDNKLLIYDSHQNSARNGTANAELEGWKAKYGKDENLKRTAAAGAMPFNPGYSVRFEYNSTKANKTVTLDGSYVDTKNNKYQNSIVLRPYTSAILIKQK